MLRRAEFNTADGFKVNDLIDINIREAPPMFIERPIHYLRATSNLEDIKNYDRYFTRIYSYQGMHIDPITKRETLVYAEEFKP